MKKTTTFRLDEDTQAQIAWIAKRKGITATDVIRLAVADMFEREMTRIPRVRLEDGIFYLQDRPLLQCSPALLEKIPPELLEQARQGNANVLDLVLHVMLLLARYPGEQVILDEQFLRDTTGIALPGT